MKYLRFLSLIAVIILGLSLQNVHEKKDTITVSGGFSDSRLKTNVKLLFKSPSGINVYSFNYIDDPSTLYQGVIAQELIGTPFDSAVIRGERYFSVDYSLIDVAFKKIPALSSLERQ